MPIDFLRFIVGGKSKESILNNSNLDYQIPVSEKTGETSTEIKIARYKKHFTIVVRPNNYITVIASLHKAFNNGSNYENLSFGELIEALNMLSSELCVDLADCKITRLEFGINIQPKIHSSQLIENVLCHRGDPFDKIKNKKSELGIECIKQRYKLKIYSKQNQYRLRNDILRLEIHTYKSIHARKYGIETLSDLKKQNVIAGLKFGLLNTLKDLLLDNNEIEASKIKSRSQRELLLRGRNPKYWQRLKSTNPNKYTSDKRSFKKIIHEHSQIDVLKTVCQHVSEEWDRNLVINYSIG